MSEDLLEEVLRRMQQNGELPIGSSQWGGKREGSGRKRKHHMREVSENADEKLATLAALSGMSPETYLDLLIERAWEEAT